MPLIIGNTLLHLQINSPFIISSLNFDLILMFKWLLQNGHTNNSNSLFFIFNRSYFLQIKLPIARISTLPLRKDLAASPGLQIIGSSCALKLVFTRVGSPVSSL